MIRLSPIMAHRRHPFLVVIGIIGRRHSHLFQVVQAFDPVCALSGFVQHRQQHCRQNGNDRNYDQKFYQSETSSLFLHFFVRTHLLFSLSFLIKLLFDFSGKIQAVSVAG